MNVTFGAVLVGAVLSFPVSAQTPAVSPATQQSADEPPVRGPKLGSPEIVKIDRFRVGVEQARLVKTAQPRYTAAAIRARLEGVVKLDAVVLEDGTVGDTKVTQALDPELDTEAVATMRKWIFKPATIDGKAVPVQVEIEMHFTLRGKSPGK